MGQAERRAGAVARRSPPRRDEFRVRKKLLGGYELELGEADDRLQPQQSRSAAGRPGRNAQLRPRQQRVCRLARSPANNIGPAAFAAMDVDGDGKVFKGELTSFMTRQNDAAAARLNLVVTRPGAGPVRRPGRRQRRSALAPRTARRPATCWTSHDKNGDGVLGGDEVPQRLEFELVRGVDERVEAETFVRCRVVRSTTQGRNERPALVPQDGPQQRRRPEPARIRRSLEAIPPARCRRRRPDRPRRGRSGREVVGRLTALPRRPAILDRMRLIDRPTPPKTILRDHGPARARNEPRASCASWPAAFRTWCCWSSARAARRRVRPQAGPGAIAHAAAVVFQRRADLARGRGDWRSAAELLAERERPARSATPCAAGSARRRFCSRIATTTCSP